MSKKRRGYLYKGGADVAAPAKAPAKRPMTPALNRFKSAAQNVGAQAKQGLQNVGAQAKQGLQNVGAQATQGAKNLAAQATQGAKNLAVKTGENLKPENIKKNVQKAVVGSAFGIAKTGLNALIPPVPFPPVSTLRAGLNETLGNLEKEVKSAVEGGLTPEARKQAFDKIAKTLDGAIEKHGSLLQQTFGVNIMDKDFRENIQKTLTQHGPNANIEGIMGGINKGINDIMTKNPNIFAAGGKKLTFIDPSDPEAKPREIDMSELANTAKDSMNKSISEINNKIEKETQESIKQQTGQSENPVKALFKEKTEEEKEEEKLEEEAEKISWQETFNELSHLYKDFKLAPGKVKLFIVLAYIIILFTSILSIYYVVRIFLDYKNSLLIKNQINFESLDYNISRSLSFNPMTLLQKNIKYKFVLFLILPMIAFALIGLAFFYTMKESNRDSIKTIIYILIGIAIVQASLSMVVNYLGYLTIRKDIVDIQKKISEFNNYIYLNLYRHEPFLNVLQMIPTNSFSMIKGIQVAMDNIAEEDKSDPDKIAKVLFTLNIYIHLQKMGFRNPNIRDAFKLFDKYHTSDPKLFTPSDYIYRKPTYISNYTTKIIDIYKSYKGNTNIDLLPGFIDPNESSITDVTSDIVGDTLTTTSNTLFEFAEAFETQGSNISDDVFELAKEPIEGWVRNLNDLAFKMNPEKSFGGFIKILILIALASIIPIIILVVARTLRHKLFKLVMFFTKSKKERLNIQINETQLMIDQLTLDLNNTNSSKKKKILQEKINIYKDKLNGFKTELTEVQKEKNE